MVSKSPILFVGAGPGDPELITVKGQKALEKADVIIYAGSLVPEGLLKWADPEAEVHNSAGMNLDQILEKMIIAYEMGRRVVRLHTGDPSLYGAIFEQTAALEKQSIPFRIIPGVTAAFAAAATLGIEYTIPEITQTLILTRVAGRTPVPDAESLESLAKHRASMVIYLSVSMIEKVARTLGQAYGEKTMGAVVYRASQGDEKKVLAPLKDLASEVQKVNIDKHAVVIVGPMLNTKGDQEIPVSRLYAEDFSHGWRKGKK